MSLESFMFEESKKAFRDGLICGAIIGASIPLVFFIVLAAVL